MSKKAVHILRRNNRSRGNWGALCPKNDFDKDVYAETREECEALLPGLIAEMTAEIRAIKRSGDLTAIPDGISKKKRRIAAYPVDHQQPPHRKRGGGWEGYSEEVL